MPEYDLQEFFDACSDPQRVGVRGEAEQNARNQFGLKTKINLLEFIAEGGLESPKHINTKLWDKNPNPSTPVQIDAYSFYSGEKYGYIAFRYNPKLKTWYIKSFKLNREKDPRNLAFSGLARLLNKE